MPKYIDAFMQIIRSAGFQIYIVGGPVRDMLLNRPITNWDFATNAKPQEVLKLFPDAKYENDYGTVLVPLTTDIGETTIAEITPFRKESTYSDSRHPDTVQWADFIEEDVVRRDFTINALAHDGKNIIDLVHGQEDIKNGIIRAVGDPDKRFTEDALRLLRAIRFASQLSFTIEPHTLSAVSRHAEKITHISWERIRDELLKIITSPHGADGVMMMRSTTLLKYILPELDDAFGIDQKSPERHHQDDVGTHSVQTLRHTPSPDPVVRLGALLHDIGKPDTRAVDERGITTFYNHEIIGATLANQIAHRLRLSKKDRLRLVMLVRHHMFSVSELQTDKALRRFIRKVGLENVDGLLDIRTGDRVGSGVPETSWRTELFKKRLVDVQHMPFTIHDLKISGHDVMEALSLQPGPEVGNILKKLFEMVENEEIANEKEALMKALKVLR